MYDLQYNGGKQLHTATGLTAACTHKSAPSSSQPTSQSTQCISMMLLIVLAAWHDLGLGQTHVDMLKREEQ